jgi:ATP-dependent DNA helicase
MPLEKHVSKAPHTSSTCLLDSLLVKIVNNMHLQNKIMQLRKVCSHPYLFHWPNDPDTGAPDISSALLNASGKMLLLNQLLTALFERKHKVLIFSQFTSMLDIIEDWATEFKGWDICRIDGSTSPLDRREQMDRFNNGGEEKDACRLFLLSTRAGGLGINLVAADTVIFYDQDWVGQL